MVVSGTKSAVPFSCWLRRDADHAEADRAGGGLDGDAGRRAGSRWCGRWLRSITATRARVCSSAGVYQRPALMPVAEHRRLADGPDAGVLAGELDVGDEGAARWPPRPGWRGSGAAARASSGRPSMRDDAGRPRRGRPTRRGSCRLMPAARPSTASRVPTASAIDQRGGQAAPPAPADVAQADLRRARQEADAPQERVARVLAADRGPGRLQRLAQRQPHGAPDRGQRRQRRREQADQRADEHDAPSTPKPTSTAKTVEPKKPVSDVREHDPERRSRRRFRARRAAAPSCR